MILYHARWLLPISEPPIEYGTVAVDGGRIAYVGPRVGAPRGTDRDLGDVVLMPGLVNAHARLELTGLRGLLDGRPAVDRDRTLARATDAVLTADALLDAARLGVTDGLRAGVTTFADWSASGTSMRAMTEAGVRGVAYQEVAGARPDAESRARVLAALRDTIDRLRAMESDLVRLGVALGAPHATHEDVVVDAAAYALGERLPLAAHVAASAAEVDFLREASGPLADAVREQGIAVERRAHSPVHLLKELGVLDVARPLLVHCVALDASDVAFIADSGCPVAHCPAANAADGAGIAPIVELLDTGVTVGLGTGSPATGVQLDVLDQARLALLLQRARTGRPDVLGPAQATAMATLGGARALGLDDRIGSLEVGKEADLAAFPVDPTGASAVLSTQIPFAMLGPAGARASFVAVAGVERVRDGRPASNPDPGLIARVRARNEALAAWIRLDADSMRERGPGPSEPSSRESVRPHGGAPPPGI